MDRNPTPQSLRAIFWRPPDLLLNPSPTRGRTRIVSPGALPPALTLGCCVSSKHFAWLDTNCRTAERTGRSLTVVKEQFGFGPAVPPRQSRKRMSAMNVLDNFMEPFFGIGFFHVYRFLTISKTFAQPAPDHLRNQRACPVTEKNGSAPI